MLSVLGKSSQLEGSQASEEAAIEETSFSIDNMIKELSQAGGSEVPMIEAGGAFTSAWDVAEGKNSPFLSFDHS